MKPSIHAVFKALYELLRAIFRPILPIPPTPFHRIGDNDRAPTQATGCVNSPRPTDETSKCLRHLSLHAQAQSKKRCNVSAAALCILGWLMGLTAHDTNHLIFKDFFGNAMEFDEKT